MRYFSRLRLPLIAALSLGIHAARPSALAQTSYSHGDPSAQEQLILQLINQARANPPAAGARVGLAGDFAKYPARPPLAFNAALLKAAHAHNADLDAHGTFSHYGSDGSLPADRIVAAGYPSGYSVIGENISYGYTSSLATFDALLIDEGESDLGHRRNYLEYDTSHDFYREFGAALDTDSHALSTQDFASHGAALITGVAFRDTDGDAFYSVGEGVGGVGVSSPQSSYVTTTSASGGYALPMDKAGSLSAGVTVVFRDGSGTVYTRHLNLASTTADGAPDNVESDLNLRTEAADVVPVTLQVHQPVAVASTATPASVVFRRAGNDLSRPLTVNYKIGGTARSGVDYKTLPGTLTIPAGSASVKLKIKPRDHANFPTRVGVKIILKPGDGYEAGDTAKAKVSIVGSL